VPPAYRAPAAYRQPHLVPLALGVTLITLLVLAVAWVTSRAAIPSPSSGAIPVTVTGLPRADRQLYLPSLYAQNEIRPPTTLAQVATPAVTATMTASPVPSATPIATMTATATDTPPPTQTVTPSATATPWPTPDGLPRQVRVPILMYHHIAVPPPDADAIERDLSVTPADFEAQLQWLAQNGYTSISLYDLVYALAQGKPLPPRPVILTFDDGYRDAYENAFPLLQKYGFKGTFFVITEFIDQNYPDYLAWSEVDVMNSAGMDIEPHTKTHPDLRGRDHDFLIWQILGSAQTVEAHIGHFPRFFAYPSGRYDAAVLQVVQKIGLWGVVTTQQGTIHASNGLYELKRVRIRNSDTLDSFALKLGWDF